MATVNHIGITVGDLDAGIEFYRAVLGAQILVPAATATLHSAGGERRRDIFGPGWGGMRIAHLAAADGTGIELFEFLEPPVTVDPTPFSYSRTGVFHVAFTVDDVDATSRLIEQHRGTVRSSFHDVNGNARVVYCQDPWSTVIELCSAEYRRLTSGM